MINASSFRKFLQFLFLSIFLCLPISQWLSGRLLVLTLLLSLLLGLNRTTAIISIRRNWDIAFYTLVLILGLINSENLYQGMKVLETHSAIFCLPFLFNRFVCSERLLDQVCKWFTLGVIISALVSIIVAILRFQASQNWTEFFYYPLLEPVGIQPTYMAYYVIFAIIWILYSAYYRLTRIFLGYLFAVIVFLFVVLILTGGYTAFMSIILSFSFFLLKYLLDTHSTRKTVMALFVTLLLGTLLGVSAIGDFKELIKNQTDYWERGMLWRSAISANPNPIIGVGTGDYIKTLNEYYEAHGMIVFATKNYNSHNQFIQNYFSNGLIGLLALMILVLRPIYLAFKSQNTFMILVSFPFLLYGINEVFLGRFQGVVFFGLCSLLSVTSYYFLKPRYGTRLSDAKVD